jgi:hypothetical protein
MSVSIPSLHFIRVFVIEEFDFNFNLNRLNAVYLSRRYHDIEATRAREKRTLEDMLSQWPRHI